MGVSWQDLDERTRERLLVENPELAAEFGPKQKAAGAREPVDPAVQALLDAAEANKQRTLDLRSQAGLVRAEAQLLSQQTMLRRAREMSRSRGRGEPRGRHRHHVSFWTTALLLFPVCYVVVALAGGG